MPKISVLMSVYNGEKFLKEAIESILNQSYKDFEFIIVNDGSTDQTEEIIKNFNDSRIKYFKKENSGIVDSLNLGLEKSKGEFIARMDADDISIYDRLEKQISFFENNPEHVLVGTWATKIDEKGNEIGDLSYTPIDWKSIKKYAILHNPFIHPSVMFRRSLIDLVGKYNKKYLHTEDYEFWSRIIFKHPVANISEKLLKYRIHGNSITSKNTFKMRIMGVWVRMLVLFRSIFGSNF